MNFKIEVEDFEWIDGSQDNDDDLCLHGHATAYIGERKLEYDATVSATALYLLKSLTEDHIINEDNQMLPCCGFSMIPDEKLENVTIIGCPNGIDWSVIHKGDSVKLILEDGTETIIPLSEYEKEVFRFADKVESFYMSCSLKKCLRMNMIEMVILPFGTNGIEEKIMLLFTHKLDTCCQAMC